MNVLKKWFWVPLNLVGIGVFLLLASDFWVQPGTEGEPGGPGDAFFWFFVLLPLRYVFGAFDLVTLGVIVTKLRKTERIVAISTWAALVILWILVTGYDEMRSMRYVDAEFSTLPAPQKKGPTSLHSQLRAADAALRG